MSFSETVDRVMAGELSSAGEDEKAAAVRDVIQVASIAAAAAMVQPLPLLDLALLAPIQMTMVQAIGRVHGHKLDRKSVMELLSTFGGTLVTRSVVLVAARLVPFAGWAMSIPMGYALTYAMGEVADHYFRTGRGVQPRELRAMFRRIYDCKRAEKAAAAREGDSLKARLERLTEAYAAGLITEEEYRRKKEEILRDL